MCSQILDQSHIQYGYWVPVQSRIPRFKQYDIPHRLATMFLSCFSHFFVWTFWVRVRLGVENRVSVRE